MHFLENSMFVLNAYFCRELRFVAILRSKLRFLLRNTGVDSDFTQNFWGKNWRLKALLYSTNYPMSVRFLKIPLQIVEDKGAKLRRKAVIIIIRDQVYVSSGLIICSNKTGPEQESILQLRISTVQLLLNDHQFIQAVRVGIQRSSIDQWFFLT